ncbi:MAG: hypothetical protein LBD87_07195 [Prevotellaceae bacterium]|jgi:hypothetical protein|nr:hypothetical protein [Prevotellaceae bacterium]
MKYLYLITGWLCGSFAVQAQVLEERAANLPMLMRQAAAETDSVRKTAAMAVFAAAFEETLRREAAPDNVFDSIPYLGMLVSPDRKVRIFTWNLPLTATQHRYFGVVQYRTHNTVRTTVLSDVKDSLAGRPETITLNNGRWFGALYYDLLQNKTASRVYYTLLGYDFHSGVTHRKLLDVLTFDEQGVPSFGAPLFDNGRWKASRVLLEYSAATPFYLSYLPRKKMIVFQRLETVSLGGLPGRVPSGEFDGLQFYDGEWKLQKNLDITPKDFEK